jgi:hypothetical protein
MTGQHLPKSKVSALRRRFIERGLGASDAREFQISLRTLYNYRNIFESIRQHYPDRLKDMAFFMRKDNKDHRPTPKYMELVSMLPNLVADEPAGLVIKELWQKYLLLKPDGYSYNCFKTEFKQWAASHPLKKRNNLLPPLYAADLAVLEKWRYGNDHRKWQIARTLQMAATPGVNVYAIMQKVDSNRKTVNRWLALYREKGLPGLELPKPPAHPNVIARMKLRSENFFKLLQDPPKRHGLNLASWTMRALGETYNKVYNDNLSYHQTTLSLRKMGYHYKKSRDILVSPDANYREKINRIQHILQKLGPTDKFFSIDEYGPVGIKLKGGRTLKPASAHADLIPQNQRSKGFLICNAALELSTNQVTHIYARRKNTFETIKLLETLLECYPDQKRLYLSWDAASWHRSGILKNFIEDSNAKGGPQLIIVPLPSTMQYLNVIESVFGGLARAVIHNSNYASVEECKAAIDRHFTERNAHFQANPKRAGNKIWGKEIVVATFKDTHHCKDLHAMSSGTTYDESWKKRKQPLV